MKRNRYLSLLISGLITGSTFCLFPVLTACGSDPLGHAATDPSGEFPVTFSIGTPASGEVEYTRVETESGKQVNSLKVYDFRVIGSGFGKKVLLSTVHYLKKVSAAPKSGEFTTGYNSSDGSLTATFTLSLRGTGNTATDAPHIFAFVANEEALHFDSIIRPGETPLDSLLYCFSTRRLKTDGNCDQLGGSKGFVMTSLTGEMSVSKDMGVITGLPQLSRIVARIDVKHSVLAARNLKIVSLSARNCVPRGYLFGTDYAGSATGEKNDYTHVVSVKHNTNVQSALENLSQGTCENVLYLYEQPAAVDGKDTSPVLLLTYTLNGAVNTMEVPLPTDSRLDIRRNTRYTLVVGTDNTSTRVVCRIQAE